MTTSRFIEEAGEVTLSFLVLVLKKIPYILATLIKDNMTRADTPTNDGDAVGTCWFKRRGRNRLLWKSVRLFAGPHLVNNAAFSITCHPLFLFVYLLRRTRWFRRRGGLTILPTFIDLHFYYGHKTVKCGCGGVLHRVSTAAYVLMSACPTKTIPVCY